MSEQRFRDIFRRVHAAHSRCLQDEWLTEACRDKRGRPVERPIVWSRRNGTWRAVDILWVGAAPGNAGGRGSGILGAHATRIPFGGDVAGANLDVLLSSIGVSRNDTFITAVLNQLPAAGGGEPTFAELTRPVGDFASSLHLLRDTILAAQPRLIVALGIVGLRALIAATRLQTDGIRLPTQNRLAKAGFARGPLIGWPEQFHPDDDFVQEWPRAGLPDILWLTHPSAQNMSPYAGTQTVFYKRMIDARDALRSAVHASLGWHLPGERVPHPDTGIYALKEWRDLIGPRHDALDALWRQKGV